MTARSKLFQGIGASPGIAIGRVFLLDRRGVRIPRYHIQPDQIDYEVSRLRAAVAKSVAQLDIIRNRFRGEGLDHQTILEAHEMMLRDQALQTEAADFIRVELINAEWAVNRVVVRLRGLFDRMSDAYFRERRGDIDFIGDRILRNLAGQAVDLSDIGHLDDGTVIVARDLSPVDATVLSRQRVTAFVIEVGGKTSHTSIIARSLGVPAVVGVRGITETAGSGDLIVVDGIEGSVMLRPSHAQMDRGRRRSDDYQRNYESALETRTLPAETLDGHVVTIGGNIELPTEVAAILNQGAEVIGLYRTEFLFLGRSDLPTEEDHYRTYCQLFEEVGDREVTVRTLDLGGEKMIDVMLDELEPNPALGLRAIRYCLKNPKIFEDQIAGLLRAAVHGNIRIMLPMISGVEELRAAKEIIDRVIERLKHQGRAFRADIPVGIMIEVPSAAVTADLLAKESAFFAVGTNDLMQYLMAVDRSNERVDYLNNPLNPAMLRTLNSIASAAVNAKIPVSVCGEMAGELIHLPIFLALNVNQLSMNTNAIPRIKRLVRTLRRRDCTQLLSELLACDTHITATETARAFLAAHSVKRPESKKAANKNSPPQN